MFASGFVLVVVGFFLMFFFGTRIQKIHNVWDNIGAAAIVFGFFFLVAGVFSVLWDYLP